jgi:hypothetical protein
MSRPRENLNAERMPILDLFRAEDGFRESGALLPFKESAERRHVSKWRIAAPVFEKITQYLNWFGVCRPERLRNELLDRGEYPSAETDFVESQFGESSSLGENFPL